MKTAWTVVLGEVRKSLLVSWTYRVNTLATLLTLAFTFLAICFLMGGGKLKPEMITSALVGYLTWSYAAQTMSDVSYGLRGEMQAGTLEQMSMSPVPIGLILIGRVLATLMIGTVQALILGIALVLLTGAGLPLRWVGLPVLIATLVGVLGFGFIIAGAVLILKHVESMINLLINILVFLNGTMLPVEAMPAWLAAIARALPSTQGIIVLRRILLDGRSLASTWQDRSLVWLLVNSVIYFAVGWIVFTTCERVAKRQGSLGQY
jgi:ABC-2 type transport system permease protein